MPAIGSQGRTTRKPRYPRMSRGEDRVPGREPRQKTPVQSQGRSHKFSGEFPEFSDAMKGIARGVMKSVTHDEA